MYHRLAVVILLALAVFFASTTAYVLVTRAPADPCLASEVGVWNLRDHARTTCVPFAPGPGYRLDWVAGEGDLY